GTSNDKQNTPKCNCCEEPSNPLVDEGTNDLEQDEGKPASDSKTPVNKKPGIPCPCCPTGQHNCLCCSLAKVQCCETVQTLILRSLICLGQVSIETSLSLLSIHHADLIRPPIG